MQNKNWKETYIYVPGMIEWFIWERERERCCRPRILKIGHWEVIIFVSISPSLSLFPSPFFCRVTCRSAPSHPTSKTNPPQLNDATLHACEYSCYRSYLVIQTEYFLTVLFSDQVTHSESLYICRSLLVRKWIYAFHSLKVLFSTYTHGHLVDKLSACFGLNYYRSLN